MDNGFIENAYLPERHKFFIRGTPWYFVQQIKQLVQFK